MTKGRPRSFDEETALMAATEVFSTLGYEGASLTALTQAMKINRPSFYLAFKSKEALFIKVLDHYFETRQQGMKHILFAEGLSTYQAFEELFSVVAEKMTECKKMNGCLIANSSIYSGHIFETVEKKLAEIAAKREQLIVERLTLGQDEQDVPDDLDVASAGRFISVVFQGLAVHLRMNKDIEGLKDIANSGISYIRYLLKKERTEA